MIPKRGGYRKEQVSHIFTGEDPSSVKQSKKGQMRNQVSHVIFNDSYFERHPNIKQGRKQRYLIEDKIRKESGYTDDLKQPKQTEAFKRKIKDSYLHNPMKIYNKEEVRQYNESERQKYANRAKAFDSVYGSDKCRRTLGGINRRTDAYTTNADKVTSNSFNITKKAMILNKNENQQVPYYPKRHFVTYQGDGKAMTYL